MISLGVAISSEADYNLQIRFQPTEELLNIELKNKYLYDDLVLEKPHSVKKNFFPHSPQEKIRKNEQILIHKNLI